jgi:integrase
MMANNKRDHGDGGIDERGEGRWRMRYRVGGKRFTKSFRGSISDARKELRRLLKSGDDGQHVAPDKITLAEWVKEWIATRQINERTRERYEGLLREHVLPTLGIRRLQSLMPNDLDKLYRNLANTISKRTTKKLSTRTIHHVHIVLSGCLKSAVRKDVLTVNPAERTDKPKATDSTVARIVAVAAWTGARRNEILALRWADISFTAKTLTIARATEETKAFGRRTKSPKSVRGARTITIDDGLLVLLGSLRDSHQRVLLGVPDGSNADLSLVKLPETALVFPAPGMDLGQLRDVNAVTRTFERQAAKLKFGHLRFHDLRGSHETMLLDAGVPVHTVAARCGHDAAVLLRSYAKRTAGSDSNAAAIIGKLAGNVARGV